MPSDSLIQSLAVSNVPVRPVGSFEFLSRFFFFILSSWVCVLLSIYFSGGFIHGCGVCNAGIFGEFLDI